jgi:hypothetical protein
MGYVDGSYPCPATTVYIPATKERRRVASKDLAKYLFSIRSQLFRYNLSLKRV